MLLNANGDCVLDATELQAVAKHLGLELVTDGAAAMRIAAVNGSPSSLARRDELFYFKLAMQAVARQRVTMRHREGKSSTREMDKHVTSSLVCFVEIASRARHSTEGGQR